MNEEDIELTATPITPIDPTDQAGCETYLTGEIPESDMYCFIDGSCRPNPGEMFAGVYIEYKGRVISQKTYPGGIGTNNEAEFCALIQALKLLKDAEDKQHPAVQIPGVIVSDSRMVVCAIMGKYKVKGTKLQARITEIQKLMKEIKNQHTLVWSARKNNAAHAASIGGHQEPATRFVKLPD